MFASVVEVNRA